MLRIATMMERPSIASEVQRGCSQDHARRLKQDDRKGRSKSSSINGKLLWDYVQSIYPQLWVYIDMCVVSGVWRNLSHWQLSTNSYTLNLDIVYVQLWTCTVHLKSIYLASNATYLTWISRGRFNITNLWRDFTHIKTFSTESFKSLFMLTSIKFNEAIKTLAQVSLILYYSKRSIFFSYLIYNITKSFIDNFRTPKDNLRHRCGALKATSYLNRTLPST